MLWSKLFLGVPASQAAKGVWGVPNSLISGSALVVLNKSAGKMTLLRGLRVTLLMRELLTKRLGRVDYEAGLTIQKETERMVVSGQQPDTLLLLEHPHTLTIGRRGDNSGILSSQEALKVRGITVFETNRGGKITYHGLGQIVGYPIINLRPEREDVHRYVRDLEEVLIRTMADFGIEAFRITGLTGVHTRQGKVAAIGVHIARWVTTHGFALNVNTDLSFFNLIVACEGEPVTSMRELLGHEVDVIAVEDRIPVRFAEVFEMSLTALTPETPIDQRENQAVELLNNSGSKTL
jgi:lipoyl(octanoyl) transferase